VLTLAAGLAFGPMSHPWDEEVRGSVVRRRRRRNLFDSNKR